MTAPTLDELIERQKMVLAKAEASDPQRSLAAAIGYDKDRAILASLQRLDKIDKVKVPEPKSSWAAEFDSYTIVVAKADYDTLLDLLRRETVRADEATKLLVECYAKWLEDADPAECGALTARIDAAMEQVKP